LTYLYNSRLPQFIFNQLNTWFLEAGETLTKWWIGWL